MIVESEYTVKLSELGKDNMATNKAILSYLEDVGGIHSNIAGYGVLDIPTTHLSWILLEWKLKVIRRPKYAEKIKAKTWSKDSVKCYAYRDFEIYDEQGNLIVLAASKWVLVDTEKGKIARIDKDLLDKYQPELAKSAFHNGENEQNRDNGDFQKIQIPEKYQSEVEYQVRRADIDVNNHMHNLNYLDLANEALPQEVYRGKHLDNVRITYKKEIKLDEIVKCKYAFENGKHIVVVKNQDETIVHAIIEME